VTGAWPETRVARRLVGSAKIPQLFLNDASGPELLDVLAAVAE
jgi:hypothetical protein